MAIYRCIAPDWLRAEDPSIAKSPVRVGEFSEQEIDRLNAAGFNIYFLPNYPSHFEKGVTVEGSHIDTFRFVLVDMDLKDGTYADKDSFLETLGRLAPTPSLVIDSGNGVHAYWQVSDLDAMSYLKLSRRLMRLLKTDPAVGQIFQLMRAPGTWNTKEKDNRKPCSSLYTSDAIYTAEALDAVIPPLSQPDEDHCRQHYEKTYRLNDAAAKVDDRIPPKFAKLLRDNREVKEIWSGNTDDRSKSDYRLGHIMLAAAFSREEATSVLVNSAKALARGPSHRLSYAQNIIDKVWAFERAELQDVLDLSSSVAEILAKGGDTIKGTRFPCWRYLDNTQHGFRLGQVIGLVAGSGVGKTAVALNMFMGFVQNNPDYDHFFVPLEQPANEIADRWRTLCGDNTLLHEKVHVISNYAPDGSFRHLSFEEIKDYLLRFQEKTGRKVGCVVIDHIGALKKHSKDGRQSIEDICHHMKAFAVHTNTMLVMQSQSPREKAGIGDLELNKDAAYGTVYFEAFCDYLVTLWQPLKRCYPQGAPTVTAFKFCKIRHKNQNLDEMKEDERYLLMFDPATQHMRELTQDEEEAFKFFATAAANLRKQDRKTEIVPYKSIKFTQEVSNQTH